LPLIDLRYRCENGGRSHDAVAFASREGQEDRRQIAACFAWKGAVADGLDLEAVRG
jgi:hypothetical protein